MEVRIDSVVVHKRIRSDLGDLEPMMESLRRHGQLSPILINRRSELIAGHRRLESARRLGWTSVHAVMVEQVSDQSMLELEIEENVQRKELNEDELACSVCCSGSAICGAGCCYGAPELASRSPGRDFAVTFRVAGTTYRPTCLTSCCRATEYQSGRPCGQC